MAEGEIVIPVEADTIYEMTLHFGAPATCPAHGSPLGYNLACNWYRCPRGDCTHVMSAEWLADHKKARIKRMHQLYARRRR